MLFLNGKDIEAAVDKVGLIEQMEKAMYIAESGEAVMPPRSYVTRGEDSLGLMPCFSDEGLCTKLVTIFPGNQEGPHPVVNGMVILNDSKNGEPLAILDGQVMTALRTGAVGAVGVKHLSPTQPHALGLVGAGVQGFEQVRFAAAIRPLSAIYVYDQDTQKVSDFFFRIEPYLPDVSLQAVGTVEEMLAVCKTVIMATTSQKPVLPDDPQLLKGKSFVGIGSYQPQMREFPKAAYPLAGRLFTDTAHARIESGDVIVPLEENWIPDSNIDTLGHFLLSDEDEKSLYDQTTLYKSVGMALFDLLASSYVYERAIKMGLGQRLER